MPQEQPPEFVLAVYKDKNIDCLLFTGVAGAAKKDIQKWDIVIADSIIQYDMDARPLLNSLRFQH